MRRGQVALYLVAVLVGLFIVTLLNVDAFGLVRGKNRTQNAGDAAAIAAAHEQGRLLNMIGRLNVEHIIAAVQKDRRKCEEIVMEQRRLALLGPLNALRLADKAARKNGMPVNDGFTEVLRKHAETIRTVYCGGTNARGEPYPEPYPGAWDEYATEIEMVIFEGLACGADNIEFFGAKGGHYLLMQEFYHAVAAPDWCWFKWNAGGAGGLISQYGNFHDWGPLPTREEDSFDNSEIFGLHVKAWTGALTTMLTTNEIQHVCDKYGERKLTDEEMSDLGLLADAEQVWFTFGGCCCCGGWGKWFEGLYLANDSDRTREFPLVGEVKDEYNVRGCAAVCRCAVAVQMVSPGTDPSSTVTWCAAAKPFGTVENFKGEEDVATALNSFVVPCFRNVRLVPLDAVGAGNIGTADYVWITHLREHLPEYMETGPNQMTASECFYCRQLVTWERKSFRHRGEEWLKLYADTCVRSTTGGGMNGGGTSYGH